MKEKIALVTGSNRGIGFAIVKSLAKLGFQVILTSRKEEDGKKALKKLGNPASVLHYVLDVTSEESILDIYAFTKAKFGKLDVLINNAGINYDTYQNVYNADLQNVKETLNTNVMAPWKMIQTFLPLLRKSDAARIVNVSSGLGSLDSQTGSTPGYSLSKLALNGLTLQFSNTLKRDNILVNAVCPGWVRTDMGGFGATRSPEKGAETIVWAAQLEDNTMTGKFFRDKKEIAW